MAKLCKTCDRELKRDMYKSDWHHKQARFCKESHRWKSRYLNVVKPVSSGKFLAIEAKT